MTSHPLIAPRRQARLMLLVLAAMPILLAVLAAPSSARSPGRASPTEGPGDVAAGNQATDTDGVPPAPPSMGANIPLEYFGPMASEVNKKLVGPVQLLRSGTLSRRRTTIELPLYRGELRDGRSVWCILTDTTDKSNAEALGLNHAAKLRYSEIDSAVREGRLTKRNGLVFDAGAVDFSPDRRVVPGAGANAFPPRVNEPGSVGDRNYTPLVKITNAGGHIYNAPVVAFNQRADQIRACTGGVNHNRVHDRVVKICPTANGGGTVTIRTTPIFSFAKPALYISMDSSEPVTATLDEATLAPAIADVPVGGDDARSRRSSACSRSPTVPRAATTRSARGSTARSRTTWLRCR